ncbi:hypothetical protein MUA77_00390 [Mammaliicoccus sciuri]|uniref:nuclease domain-containing protein n=1 Tax=Mammaliicoccus sciuri TaxID=1296 RepID=UPI0021D131BD|nr:nuclease domain-containing protein [Mammaliicoccus sciuri]UXU83933.1 hypothetical protein MUA77_00390 [Mammaliicoccus sciuri]UXU93780.1 hypothetical protein MUA42_00390 [Mammaliicoccus sciuri]UXV15728.1 hypothetical protein MUA89_00390 [Mammaliicoccus sciuri]UXV23990.1 hypothetical protein MUA49_00390 [Mammaliicoccus sciuri]UXV26771.1 hypothetical protein MUA96_00390 [Mammaliicoccus sciuri]
MDILTDLPFELEFEVFNNKEEKIINRSIMVKELYANIHHSNQEIPIFTEYDYIKVSFRNKDEKNIEAKLYMNYFEFLREENYAINLDEEQNSYIKINNTATIHTHKNNDTGIPLIPGFYQYYVYYDNKNFYGQFQVAPKNMELNVHSEMISQIESHSLGLARDFLRKQSGLSKFQSQANSTILDQGIYLIKNKHIILNALKIIQNSPISSFKNEYFKTKINKSIQIDNKSLILNNKKNIDLEKMYVQNEKVYTKNKTLNLSNEENKYIANSLKKYLRILNDSIHFCDLAILDIEEIIKDLIKYNNNKLLLLERQNEVKDLKELSKELKSIYRSISKNYNIKQKFYLPWPKVSNKIMRYPGYRDFFKINKDLKNNLEDTIQDQYSFKWKSSDVLYEYWCFLELIKVFKNIGFEAKDGWIFSDIRKNIIIPRIPDGSYVTFVKEDYKVDLIFNKPISKENKSDEHYWIRHRKNKPDFRLDIYYKSNFKKTIILDSKYSPADKIWQRDTVIEQLNIYKNMVVSTMNPDFHVVKEVIALTPTLFKTGEKININNNFLVTIATFSPDIDNEELIDRIQDLIYNI